MIKPEDFEFIEKQDLIIPSRMTMEGKFGIISQLTYNSSNEAAIDYQRMAKKRIIQNVVEEFYPRSLRNNIEALYDMARRGAISRIDAAEVDHLANEIRREISYDG